MLGNLFLFSGRIGRARYFLWSVLFVPVFMTVALRMLPALNSSFWPSKSVAWAVLLLIYAVPFWMEFSLQAARVRDIGWGPGTTIVGLLAINGVIVAIDYCFPAWSTETNFFAIFSTGINTLAALAFQLMPTAGDGFIPRFSVSKPSADTSREIRPEPPEYRMPLQPISVPSRRVYPREKVPFGRRGLT